MQPKAEDFDILTLSRTWVSENFLEVNIDFFLSLINAPENGWTFAEVRAKFDWMYQRIKIAAARELATPLYEQALQKLRDKEGNTE